MSEAVVDAILTAEGLTRHYGAGEARVVGCEDVSLAVRPGELLVVRGRSGAGKSTLLRLLGGLDRPTAGAVRIGDLDVAAATEGELVELHRDVVGFVHQEFGLLPTLTAAENVELPLRIARRDAGERVARVAQALASVGLDGHENQRPGQLSGGQQQRVAIARALVSPRSVLIADEPTGQLDSETGAQVMDLVVALTRERGVATVVATHDPLVIAMADHVVELRDGRVRAVGDED
ncbi:ABC transporter ATP-binding protein [Curtobacterium sp. MCBA15_008]|uniref:ABC transporter ATP-binding protein n=1 Tax=Curtobacterium sp. MCBA15_008 TaxID=1898736 RepID=UPI0008DE6CA4|nr:ABC transporter ATP-binding protein [Curtobacterium sp. MCBA15_008]OII06995.1 ABC transporter [Curtobacterium sp. MCBA15_008]